MRVVYEPVEDAVSDGGIADLCVPARHRQLTGKQRGTRLVSRIADLQEVAALRFAHRRHRPVVHHQQVDPFEPVQKFTVAAVGARVKDLNEARWERLAGLGVLRVTRAALPLMPHDAGASIINIGSVAGHTAYEGGAVYCAAKAGELQITRALRMELNGTGIRIGTVDPGLAETEFSLVRFKGDAERAKNVYAGIHALTAEDIAEILVWVASRPPHVNIDELLVKPVDQAAMHKIYRRKN